jgi:hypothetical protein
MSHLRAALARHRSVRAQLRDERAMAAAMASAPTRESAHEIVALSTRR